jgi:hypothetical protein
MWGIRQPSLGAVAALYTFLTMIAMLVSYRALISAESATAATYKNTINSIKKK